MDNSTDGGIPNKKRKTRIATINHLSMEEVSSTMDKHTYEVSITDESFFNNNRSIEESFEKVVKEVIEEIKQDVDYNALRMRVGLNFTFGEEGSDRKFYVNINYHDIAIGNAVTEILRRLQLSFQSGDKASFAKFKVIATVFRIHHGQGLN